MRRTIRCNPPRRANTPLFIVVGAIALLLGLTAEAATHLAIAASTLPPLPLVGMELVGGVLLLDRYAGKRRRNRPWWSLLDAIGLAALMAAGSLYFWSSPFDGAGQSFAGRFSTGLIALSVPLLLVCAVIQLCRSQACTVVFTWFLGLAFCLLASANVVFVGVTLACALTGSCIS